MPAIPAWKRARKRREAKQKRARLEYLEAQGIDHFPPATVALLQSGDCELCPNCGGVSAYAWSLCAESDNPSKAEIAHIPAASCFDWQCGHCRATFAPADSPTLSPCFTHSED